MVSKVIQKLRAHFVISLGVSALILGQVSIPANSVVLQNMSVAYHATLNGNLATTGNSVLTCSTTTGPYADLCSDARARKGSRLNNDDFVMTNLKVSFGNLATATYFNSSSGTLVIPTDAQIVHATLFWSGNTRLNSGDTAAQNSTLKNQVLFARGSEDCVSASDGCRLIARAADVYQVNAQSNLGPYRASADVTAKLTDPQLNWTLNGPHQSLKLSVANIQTILGRDKAAGWGLIVAYEDPSSAPRAITILKGFAQESMIQDDEFIFDDFKTADSGNVLSDLAIVAVDGDAGITGDSMSIIDSESSAVVADRVNPDDNLANSTISVSGIHSPYLNNSEVGRSTNTFGIDVDHLTLVNAISNSVSTAKIWPSATNDVYFISGLAMSVEITSPDLVLTKFVSNVSGGDASQVEAGDAIEYTVIARNEGQSDATDVKVRDVIPADFTVTSSTGTDCAIVPTGEICKKLTKLRAGQNATFTFSGTITGASQTAPGYFDNEVSATYQGPFGIQGSKSESVRVFYGALKTDLSSAISFSKDFIQAGNSSTVRASITNLGPKADTSPSLILKAQSGAKLTLATVPSGCLKTSKTTLTCDASALGVSVANPLQVGETAAIKLIVTPAQSTSWLTVWSTSVTGVPDGDPNPGNNTSTAKLYVNHSPVAELASLTALAGGKQVQLSLANKISDIDGDALTIELGQVKYGSAVVYGDIVSYTPPKNWSGKFTLPYHVSDGKGGSAKSSITVTINTAKPAKPDNSNDFKPSCFRFGC